MLPGTKPRTTRRSPSHCDTTPSLRSWPLSRRKRQIQRKSEFGHRASLRNCATGVIEIGPAGTGVWHTLPTQIEGSRLVARVDDAALPAGVYVLRARARDLAGNEASTDRKDDGQPMVMTLPLRAATTLHAGFEREVRRRGKRRPAIALRPEASIGFGDRVRFSGRLITGDGRAVPGSCCARSEPNRN